jgi:hypothetical protein
MDALVQQMLDLHKELGAAKTPAAQTALQRQIDANRQACPDAGGSDRRTSDTEVGRYGSTA